MLVVAKRHPPMPAVARVEYLLAHVAERRMAQVVPQADGLREVLVQAERARDVASDPAGLERVRKASAVVIAFGSDEDLRLVLQAPERLRVHDPVAVALERRAVVRVGLGLRPYGGVRARGERRQRLVLEPPGPFP